MATRITDQNHKRIHPLVTVHAYKLLMEWQEEIFKATATRMQPGAMITALIERAHHANENVVSLFVNHAPVPEMGDDSPETPKSDVATGGKSNASRKGTRSKKKISPMRGSDITRIA